ncbi:DNA cytosine methyltransferase [Phocaeicola plebeius]|jgi:DNA (cytosine-5)-methyltransferase 1|uniref:Cytosine-specific methyltransferase n=1 Tax=Phocaeicola plebeius TaxID=310297 RepID=A0A414FLV0_9BACT|nr:DNA cytosine methyltransferase [Phocaeicola plebeius]RHD50167.1 DNA cytosine methyltransferase [Phocaeicola plebeius]
MNKHYNCIDCFCGAGGLCLGLIKAGFNVIYSFDIDSKAIATMRANSLYFNSHKAEVRDIYDVVPLELLSSIGLKPGELDLLAGGPPCQGFSVQRRGSDTDDRNKLVDEYISKVIAIRPKMFILENVPGIEGKRGRDILHQALTKVQQTGYFIHEQILDAQDYGVPQRRRRVFIVGERKDHDNPIFEYPKPSEIKVTVRDTIGMLPEPPLDGTEHPIVSLHRRDRLSTKNLERIRYLKPGQGRDFLPLDLLADCHKISSNVIGHRNVYGRMPWDDVAPTITARFDSFTRGMFGHPEQDRSISLREGALLQTFPEDFMFIGNKIDIARQIGNAVPVNMAMAIGLQLIKCLDSWND